MTKPVISLERIKELLEIAEAAGDDHWVLAYCDKSDQQVVSTDSGLEIATFWHHCVGAIEKLMAARAGYMATFDPPMVRDLLSLARDGIRMQEALEL